MKKAFKLLSFSAASIAVLMLAQAAHADGMPKEPKPAKPVISPLDKAVNDIEMKEPPAAVKIEADEPAPVAPQNRIASVQKKNASFLGLSIGAFDAFREHERSVALNAEYQSGVRIAGVLQPIYGVTVTTGSAVVAYGGLGAPIPVGKKILITPSLAVAAYHKGADYDLGQWLNLRAATEIAYVFDNESRLGITGSILTNLDSLNREDRTEMIALTYTTPTTMFGGK